MYKPTNQLKPQAKPHCASETYLDTLIAGLSAKGGKFAIVKRGSIISHAFANLSYQAKVAWVLISNLVEYEAGDIPRHQGIVELSEEYFSAFNVNQEDAQKALSELIKAGFIRHLEDGIFKVICTTKAPDQMNNF